ncbi:MAG TPA: GNAT family N-acetyltransferase [Solirubrobacteraceae bacterium]|nr:GNAT family N-acetyltransferase [Solirubrobacteraceae bacterium]
MPGARDGDEAANELVTLRDGSQVTVRTATAADEPALRVLLEGLRPEALRMRFFTGAVDVPSAAHQEAALGEGRCGLVAHSATGALVAHAFYSQIDPTRAEVAVEVSDHLHGRGLGTLLIERLAELAERDGVTHFVAEVLPENHAMLDVFRDGFDAHVRFHEGVDTVEFPTAAWRAADARFSTNKRT